MKATMGITIATLHREDGDKAISHESTVGYHLKKLLNQKGYNFVRSNPSKHGLTSCKLGLRDHKRGIWLWHEQYAVEAAHKAFNRNNEVFLQRVDDERKEVSK